MIEFRDTGLPADPTVFKAFSAWRSNAKDFAAESGLAEDYPLKIAQLVNRADPKDTQLMTLAFLMSVPEPAWSVLEKRFGAETVKELDDAWKHVRTGYAYIDEASDTVKGLALAAGIMAFDTFIASADKVGETIALVQMGQNPQAVINKLLSPESKAFERVAGKISNTSHWGLEKLFADKTAEYMDARTEQNAALTEMGFMFMNGDEDGEEKPKGAPAFETTGLLDDPIVRNAYAVLADNPRVQPQMLASAISVARLLTEADDAKNPVTVAAGLLDTGLRQRNADDIGFLASKLDADVLDLIKNYNAQDAFRGDPQKIIQGPTAMKQIALATGIVMLDGARKQSQTVFDMLDARASRLPPGVGEQLALKGLQPAMMMASVVPQALAPLIGATNSPQMEQIFAAQLKDLESFVMAHMPAQAAAQAGGRMPGSRKPPPGRNFGT